MSHVRAVELCSCAVAQLCSPPVSVGQAFSYTSPVPPQYRDHDFHISGESYAGHVRRVERASWQALAGRDGLERLHAVAGEKCGAMAFSPHA